MDRLRVRVRGRVWVWCRRRARRPPRATCPQAARYLVRARARARARVRVRVRVKVRVRVRRLRGLGLGLAAEVFCEAAVAACTALRVGFTTPLGFKSEPIAATVSTALIIPSEMVAASRSTFGSTSDCCFSSSCDAAMSQAARWDAAPAHWQRGCGTKAEAARHASMCERAGRGWLSRLPRTCEDFVSLALVGGNPADNSGGWKLGMCPRHLPPPYFSAVGGLVRWKSLPCRSRASCSTTRRAPRTHC